MMRHWADRLILVGLLALTLFVTVDVPFKASSIYGISEPYLFNLSRWEAQHLLSKTKQKLKDLLVQDVKEDTKVVKEYFSLADEVRSLEFWLEQEKDASCRSQLHDKLSTKQDRLLKLESRVETIIEGQLGRVLRNEGLEKGRLLFPPPVFELDTLPNILIVSPREKIEVIKKVMLDSDLSLADMDHIERRVEQELGYSALVEQVGGVATYPSLIPQTTSLENALVTLAHEWLHHYFFFNPLGRKYSDNYEMTTINETAADIAGKELGLQLLSLYWIEKTLQPETETSSQAFDFAREMRQTRLMVDQYLALGQIETAETYMEERRQYLAEHGYHIRRLNQAYFAFHGSYADAPASTSPIGAELKTLRAASTSLGVFIKQVSRISSYQDLKRLLGNP